MSADSVEIIPDGQIHLLNELQSLLEKQMELVHKGNISGVEALSRQTDSLVRKIAESGILELAEVKNRREQLRKLYQNLCLAVAAQQAETAEKLSQVRRGKKTIEVYRNNVRFR
ncbi:hypothetical protein ES703_74000 [subsurface metagenome]